MLRYKSVYIYFGTYLLNAGLSFFTVSLLTHYITEPYDYGIINLYSSFLIFLMPFVTSGTLYPLSVEYFKRPKETYSQFFTNAQVIPLISVLFLTLLCIIFQHQLSRFLKVPPIWIWVLPITAWWIMINEVVMMISRNKSLPYQFAIFAVGKNLAEILLTIWLVIGLHLTWQGRLLSAVSSPILLGVFSIYVFFRWNLIRKEIDWKLVKRIFLISIPFIFERLAVFILGYSDKYFIDQFDLNGTKEVGLYGLGSQIASIVYLVIVSLNSAYHPHLFGKLAEGLKGRMHKSTGLYLIACGVVVVGIFIGIPILFRYFIGANYKDARVYAYLLSGGYFMWGAYNAFLGYLLYFEKNRLIFLISLVGMIVSLILNFVMVPIYGAFGAALTSISTYSIMAIFCFILARKTLRAS